MKKKLKLIVTFTYDVSLKEWADTGLIGRELLLYKRMVKDGHQVTFLTYGDKKDLEYRENLGGITVVPVYAKNKKKKNRWLNFFHSFLIPFKLGAYFRDVDIIKTNQMSGSWVAVIGKIVYGKKLVVRCGFEMLRNVLRDEKRGPVKILKAIGGYGIEFISYLLADRIIISNDSDKQFICRYFPVRKSHIALIRNFIDTSLFSPDHTTEVYAPDKKSLLFVGRLIHRKNIKTLIRAASTLNINLVLIGEGENRPEFEKFAEKKKVTIRFLGKIDNKNLPGVIKKFRFFILPSLYENNPKSLLEAMACGCVVIGTDVEGIKELIKDGVSGFLCDKDAASMAAVIKRAMQLNMAEAFQIGENARFFVEEECSLQNIYHRELYVYSEMIGNAS